MRGRRELRDATRVVRAGRSAPVRDGPFLAGPVLAAPYHLAGEVGDAVGYARFGNPTWSELERALGELEGGGAVLFASGMAAVAAVLMSALGPGGALVAPSDGYPGIRTIACEHLAPRGVDVRLVATSTQDVLRALPGATLVWLESPSNPRLDVVDLAAVVAAAHEQGTPVAVDNTLATPLGQRPLALGADLSVVAATKALSGHSDLLLGYVAAADPERARTLRDWRGQTGAVPGPFEAWLAHRSLATLELRLARQCANALELARLLATRAEVREVRYPGLSDDPAHALATRQMARFGPVVSFTLPDRAHAERFLAAAELVDEATSFGGVHTTAERRARWGTDAVPAGLVRLSAGIEHGDDLRQDLERALDAARA